MSRQVYKSNDLKYFVVKVKGERKLSSLGWGPWKPKPANYFGLPFARGLFQTKTYL